MSEYDNRNLGDRISDMVNDAVNNCDFEHLNRSIQSSINDVFDEWKIGSGTRKYVDPLQANEQRSNYAGRSYGSPISDAVEHRTTYYGSSAAGNATERPFVPGPGAQHTAQNGSPYAGQNSYAYNTGSSSYRTGSAQQKAVPQLYTKQVPGTFSGPLCTVLGGIGTGLFGLSALISIVACAVSNEMGAGAVAASVLLPLTAGSGALMGWGISLKNRAKRFRSYVNVLANRTFCDVKELAAAVDKEPKYVVKDLKKMIANRFFLHGHLDRLETTLMVDDASYQQYLETDKNYQARMSEQEEQRKKDDSIFSTVGIDDPEFIKAIAEGSRYIEEIRSANEQIPGEEISQKLFRLEEVLKKIFLVLKQKPDQLGRLRKFMNYYMPTTRKLVQTYQELDAQPVQGDNIRKAKVEIEQTLDTINDAYEKLLDSFYEDAWMDVHTDRAVLESMLKQDGLGQDPFEQKQTQQSH